MKLHLFLAILATALYVYLRNSPPTPLQNAAARPAQKTAAPNGIVIAAAPSYRDRWNTGPNAQTALQCGPNAQTDLKTGPNAQTEFEPFAPSQHAAWNQNPPGYSIVSGAKLRVR
jgi:hypothetical protein